MLKKFDVVSEENELGVCLSTDIPGCDIFGDECGAGQGCYNVRGGRACLPEGTGEAEPPVPARQTANRAMSVCTVPAYPTAAIAPIHQMSTNVARNAQAIR